MHVVRLIGKASVPSSGAKYVAASPITTLAPSTNVIKIASVWLGSAKQIVEPIFRAKRMVHFLKRGSATLVDQDNGPDMPATEH